MVLYHALTLAGSALAVPSLYLRSVGDTAGRAALRERLGLLPKRLARAQAGAQAAQTGGGTGRNLSGPRIWLQAVSVGEVRLAETFLTALHSARPGLEVVLSATTPSGLERAARLKEPTAGPHAGEVSAREVFAFPLDVPCVVSRALDTLRPAAYGSIETEIWPGLLCACARLGVPAFIVSGSVSEKSRQRYRWIAGAVKAGLGAVRAACMRSDEDAARILGLGASEASVVVTGDIKFDSTSADLSDRAEGLRQAMALPHGTPLLIAGSTSPGEEAVAVEAWKRAVESVPGLVLLVAPRHRESFGEAAAAMEAAGAKVLRRSRSTGTSPPGPGEAILLDTLGELEAAYALARVAFVGGSLVPRGGQNPLEPARAGVPVLFGSGMDNFREAARALLACGAASEVRDADSLAKAALRFLRDPAAHDRASEAGRAFVAAHAGATRKTIEVLSRLIPEVFALKVGS